MDHSAYLYRESGNSNVSMYLGERNHIFSKHMYGYVTFESKILLSNRACDCRAVGWNKEMLEESHIIDQQMRLLFY